MLHHYILNSPAFLSLKPPCRALILELQKRYNGSNNGYIRLSVREASTALHMSKDTATSCFRELQQKGFIKCRFDGSFNYKRRHASEWELTWEDSDRGPATKDFTSWKEKIPVPE